MHRKRERDREIINVGEAKGAANTYTHCRCCIREAVDNNDDYIIIIITTTTIVIITIQMMKEKMQD